MSAVHEIPSKPVNEMSVTSVNDLTIPDPKRSDAGNACGRVRLGRLFKLVLVLQSERFPNARTLANRCEVSRRTIYRDLETLAGAGIPVSYHPERQGYQLARGFFLPPTTLEESEALALLVLARQWRGGDGLGLLKPAWEGAIKLVQTLPAEARERVLATAEPFRKETREERSRTSIAGAVHETILSSLGRLRQIRTWYRTAEDRDDQCTKFSVYRLLHHDRHWFMVGRSTLHRRIEVIGIPWIRKVVLTDDRYTIPPRFDLSRFLSQAWGVDRAPVRFRVALRFSRQVAPELNDIHWHHTQRRVELSGGGVDLHFVVDGIEEVLRWVLGFGDQVEVLEPAELKRRLFQVTTGMARRHRPERASAGLSENPRVVGG